MRLAAADRLAVHARSHLPVNVRGLAIENVKTMRESPRGRDGSDRRGTGVNVAGHNVDVPRLRFAMRNAQGHEIYAWMSQTGRTMLRPGETAAFRTRLASPPADGRDVDRAVLQPARHRRRIELEHFREVGIGSRR